MKTEHVTTASCPLIHLVFRIAGESMRFLWHAFSGSGCRSLLVVDILRQSVRYIKNSRPLIIDAWVVLPDHLHAVWTLPENDFDYSSRWREIKKRFSQQLPKSEIISDNRQRRGERGIWQRRFWEHSIRSERDYRGSTLRGRLWFWVIR